MKRSGGKKFNLSNRLSYTIITVLAILLVGVGVYAYGTSNPSTFGHTISELSPPQYCGSYNDGWLVYDGNDWRCENAPSGGSSVGSIDDLGYVRISADSVSTSTLAQCPSGMKVIGGGCYGANHYVEIFRSYPYSDNSWGCSAVNPSGFTLSAFAICVHA